MSTCHVCGTEYEIADDEIQAYREDVGLQADTLGMESLTEQEQVLLDYPICSYACYENLD